jgi:FHA domain
MEFRFLEEQPMAGRVCLVVAGATVGREGCDHVLPDPEVSRRHASFRQVDAQLGVEDLGSTNGTFVNDQRVTGIQVLAPGDRVRFGNTVWRLERASVAPPAAGGAARDRIPTGVRQAISAEAVPGAMPVLDVARPPRRILGGSAARRFEATLASYVVIIGTAIAVIAFFAAR